MEIGIFFRISVALAMISVIGECIAVFIQVCAVSYFVLCAALFGLISLLGHFFDESERAQVWSM